MERLKARDLRLLLDIIHELYSIRDIETFRSYVCRALLELVPSEVVGYNEIDIKEQRIVVELHEPAVITPDDVFAVNKNMHEHPRMTHFSSTGNGSALAISDFLDAGRFQRTDPYNQFFRKFRSEDQVSFSVATTQHLLIAFGLNRSRRNVTERDKLILNLLRPHLKTAYENADALTTLKQALDPNQEVVVLTEDGIAGEMSARARQWLTEYFGLALEPDGRLPETLDRWSKEQGILRGRTDTVPGPHRTLTTDRLDRQLTIRLISGLFTSILVLEEKTMRVDPEKLKVLGLTAKEADVLAWAAMGKTNKDIAQIMGISPRTVQKHLEHVFLKLGVETRTAAVAKALEIDKNE